MGSWSVSCGISNIAITSGNKCVLLPLKKNIGYGERAWQPATLPIFAEYNDYGGIENIEEDDNTKLIEEHFGISIDDFCVFLVDGKFTYDRSEAKTVAKKIEKKDENTFEEIEKWRFMWIDRQVYDFMTINHENWHKGVLDYGNPELLKLLGFEFVEKSDKFKNYDPKRFNQLWRRGELEMFSDGDTLLSNDNQYVYAFGKGKDNETSLEHYFDVPKELDYLKEKHKHESWKLLGKEAKKELNYILGGRYDYDFDIEEMVEILKEKGNLNDLLKDAKPHQYAAKSHPIHKKYIANLEVFGDRLAQLINVSHNLHPMSGQFAPHILYLTPQCGEYRLHQIMLDKFAEINKSYISVGEDDE